MKINTALILCAGFGKRLNPITLKKPKPLIEINNVTMLEKSINLIKELGINKIILNTFYLKDHISNFIKKHEFLRANWDKFFDGKKMVVNEKIVNFLSVYYFNDCERILKMLAKRLAS